MAEEKEVLGYTYNVNGKSGLYLILDVKGNALTKDGTSANFKFVLPFEEEVFKGPDDRQEFFQPIKELFKEISSVISSLKPSWLTVGADIVLKLQDIFGVRAFQNNMHAQAWKGSNPSTFSLTLNFHHGMLDLWDSKQEVMQPISVLKQLTLPRVILGGVGGMVKSPGPTAFNVFSDFAANLLDGAYAEGSTSGISGTSASTAPADGKDETSILVSGTKGAVAKYNKPNGTGNGIWRISLLGKQGSESKLIFQSPELVCKQSSITYGNQIDDLMFPITGSISLTLESQTPSLAGAYSLSSIWNSATEK